MDNYKITHYTEGMSDGTWTEYASSQILDTIGTSHTAAPMAITGFTYDEDVTGTKIDGTLTAEGLELKLYYTRNEYPYEVRYWKLNTTEALAAAKKGSAKYGRTFTETAISIPNYTVVGENTQTKTILIENSSTEAKLNIIIFYYVENKATINYKVVGPDGCGTVTRDSETVGVTAANAAGATATANTNYRFVGWYDNDDCTGAALSTNAYFNPPKPEGSIWVDKTYYAKFELAVADLTITKSGWESIDENQSFIFTVTNEDGFTLDVVIHGNGSVTIKDLLIGQYTVTEKTNWSWRYSPTDVQTVMLTGDKALDKVTFESKRIAEYWLDGSAWRDFQNGGSKSSDTVMLSLAFVDMLLRDEEQDDELMVQPA